MNELMDWELFDPSNQLEIWIHFCSYFKFYSFVADLHKMIKKFLKLREKKVNNLSWFLILFLYIYI